MNQYGHTLPKLITNRNKPGYTIERMIYAYRINCIIFRMYEIDGPQIIKNIEIKTYLNIDKI